PECPSSGVRDLGDDLRPETGSDLVDVACHGRYLRFLPFGCRGRGFFQRGRDLKVLAVDDQADRPLAGLPPDPMEEVPQGGHLLVDQSLVRVALDHNRLVEQELAPLCVVTPDASAFRRRWPRRRAYPTRSTPRRPKTADRWACCCDPC